MKVPLLILAFVVAMVALGVLVARNMRVEAETLKTEEAQEKY